MVSMGGGGAAVLAGEGVVKVWSSSDASSWCGNVLCLHPGRSLWPSPFPSLPPPFLPPYASFISSLPLSFLLSPSISLLLSLPVSPSLPLSYVQKYGSHLAASRALKTLGGWDSSVFSCENVVWSSYNYLVLSSNAPP